MAVTKRKRKEKARENGTKENPRTGGRTSCETNRLPGQPNLYRAGSGEGDQTYKKMSQDWAFPLGSAHPHASRVYFPLLAK